MFWALRNNACKGERREEARRRGRAEKTRRRWEEEVEEATPAGMGKLCEFVCRPNFCQFWALHPCNPVRHQMVALHYLPEMERGGFPSKECVVCNCCGKGENENSPKQVIVEDQNPCCACTAIYTYMCVYVDARVWFQGRHLCIVTCEYLPCSGLSRLSQPRNVSWRRPNFLEAVKMRGLS